MERGHLAPGGLCCLEPPGHLDLRDGGPGARVPCLPLPSTHYHVPTSWRVGVGGDPCCGPLRWEGAPLPPCPPPPVRGPPPEMKRQHVQWPHWSEGGGGGVPARVPLSRVRSWRGAALARTPGAPARGRFALTEGWSKACGLWDSNFPEKH